MSVAAEFAPYVSMPAPARPAVRRPAGALSDRPAAVPLAPVAILRPPADRAPLRLTGRGVVVLGVAAAMLAIALVALARLSAPSAAPAPVAPRVVTVQPGDTLWAIATRIAPDVDPRLEVDQLRRLNSLDPGGLMPGQQLRTR